MGCAGDLADRRFCPVPGRIEALGRHHRRHRILPACERRVHRGGPDAGPRLPAGRDRHGDRGLQARRGADGRRQAEDRWPTSRRSTRPAAPRSTSSARNRFRSPPEPHRASSPRTVTSPPRSTRRPPTSRRRRTGGRRSATSPHSDTPGHAGLRHRWRRIRHRRPRRLQQHRHQAAVCDRPAGPRAPGSDLPVGPGGAQPADRRLLRLHDHPGARLRAGQIGRDGLLQQHQHPDRPHVRGGDRLLPLTRLPLPRGAPADRGQARGHAARAAARRARDLRQRPDGDARDAHPGARRQQATRAPSAPWRRSRSSRRWLPA